MYRRRSGGRGRGFRRERREGFFRRTEFLQCESRVGVALRSRLAIPEHCLLGIFREAFANLVAITQIELRGGISVLRGAFVPVNGFAEILRHALPAMIENAERKFRVRMPLLRRGANPVRGFLIVLFRAVTGRVTQAELELRGGIAFARELMQFLFRVGKRGGFGFFGSFVRNGRAGRGRRRV